MESASPTSHLTSSSNDPFASRFPHHSCIEGAAAKGQSTSNNSLTTTLPYGVALISLSDELSRFSLNLPPTSGPPCLPPHADNDERQRAQIPTTSSVSTTSTEATTSTASNLRTDQNVISKLGATKKLAHNRHLVPIKAQSIDISEVRFGEQNMNLLTDPPIPSNTSASSTVEGHEYDSCTSLTTGQVVRISRASPEPSIKEKISKIHSFDSMYTVPCSPHGSPFSSPRALRRTSRPLRESRRISIEQSGSFLKLNQYKLYEQIGQGSYGLVKLAYSDEDSTHYAMKILSKRKLLRRAGLMGRGPKKGISPLDRVYREIAVLKKLDHQNVVKLIEVLDDPLDDSLYLVFELVKQGEVLCIPTVDPLTEERAWCVFRDVVLGLEYLHYQRIIHGDLKPGNLLLGECGHVKIADLGLCNEFREGEDAMNNGSSSGTPAFRSPETLKLGDHLYSGKAADIWALGITLYALVYGTVPFHTNNNIPALYEKIRRDPVHFPESTTQHSPELKDIILRMLEKDPSKRITLSDIKVHDWVTAGQTFPLPSEEENCRPIQISDEELDNVVKSIPKLDTLILIKTMLKKHSFQNPFQKAARTSQRGVARLEHFRAGRSNSAPGAYHATLQKQFSTETCLPSLMEGCVSDNFNPINEQDGPG